MTRKSPVFFTLKLLFRELPISGFIYILTNVINGLTFGINAFLYKWIVDNLSQHTDSSVIVKLTPVFILVAVQIVMFLMFIISDVANSRISVQLERFVARDILKKSQSIDLLSYQQRSTHQQLQIAKGFLQSPYYLLDSGKLVIQTMISIFSLTIYISIVGWQIGIVIGLSLILYILFLNKQNKSEHKLIIDQSAKQMSVNYLAEMLTNKSYGREVRVFGFSDYINNKWKLNSKTIMDEYLNMKKKHYTFNFFLISLGIIVIAAAFIFVAISTVKDTASPGTFAGLVAFIGSFGTIIAIGSFTKEFNKKRAEIKEILSFLNKDIYNNLRDSHLEGEKSSLNNIVSEANINGDIRLENVWFRYPESEEYVLRNINLDIRKGESIAIVGHNGSGKTTLVNIIAGLYSPSSGTVKQNEIPYEKIPAHNLRSSRGYVFQNPIRYELTLKENIMLDEEDDVKYTEALEELDFDRLMRELSDGDDTHLGTMFGNTDLSGGWWQKVSIARSYVRDAEILILDEPTSALDPIAEAEIFKMFSMLTQGKTSILISHRLGSIKHADRIIVVENGEIVEDGSHNELMLKDGVYSRLYGLQSQWYTEKVGIA